MERHLCNVAGLMPSSAAAWRSVRSVEWEVRPASPHCGGRTFKAGSDVATEHLLACRVEGQESGKPVREGGRVSLAGREEGVLEDLKAKLS